jgi:CheY-like chemotaxis protein
MEWRFNMLMSRTWIFLLYTAYRTHPEILRPRYTTLAQPSRAPAANGGSICTSRFQLPCLAAEPIRPVAADSDGAGAGMHIWIAEDAADIRALLIDDLTSQGFNVEADADGLELIQRMTRPGARAPALVLTDNLMPGADGAAVLRAARLHLPGVPVALLSATPRLRRDGQADAPEFDASLLKPINLAELRTTLARLLGLACAQPDDQRAAAVPDAPPQRH